MKTQQWRTFFMKFIITLPILDTGPWAGLEAYFHLISQLPRPSMGEFSLHYRKFSDAIIYFSPIASRCSNWDGHQHNTTISPNFRLCTLLLEALIDHGIRTRATANDYGNDSRDS